MLLRIPHSINLQKCKVQGTGLREHSRMQKETVEWQNIW